MKISTLISFCSNDFRFLEKCCNEAKKISTEVIVVYCSHFFDGSLEDFEKIQKAMSTIKADLWIEVSYLQDRLYSDFHKMGPQDSAWAKFWAATLRYVGYYYTSEETDFVLFLDSDEIVDANRFKLWQNTKQYQDYEVMRLGSYLYALRANLRADKVINLSLIVQKKNFQPLVLLNELERIGAFHSHFGPKKESILSIDQKAMVHHYSWVRTKQECLQKANTWGHRGEEDWKKLIEDAFSGKVDFLFGLSCQFISINETFFDPFETSSSCEVVEYNKINVDLKSFQRQVIFKEFGL